MRCTKMKTGLGMSRDIIPAAMDKRKGYTPVVVALIPVFIEHSRRKIHLADSSLLLVDKGILMNRGAV